MESTNHNIWTLTKHVAGSVNKGAGKLDVMIYDNHSNKSTSSKAMVQAAPKPEARKTDTLSAIGFGVIFVILIVGCVFGSIKLKWWQFLP